MKKSLPPVSPTFPAEWGGRYSVIYADPPWWYGQRASTDRFRGGCWRHYRPMRTPEIMALPVAGLAADPCALLLWATWPNLPDALRVMEAWGFRYVTIGFDWLKLNPKSGGLFFGTGHYSKACGEPCLLGARGRITRLVRSNRVRSALLSPRLEHSRKPYEVYTRIEELFGDVPRLEMFARRRDLLWPPPGWDLWGAEA